MTEKSFLKEKLGWYLSRVADEVFRLRNRSLARGVCRVISLHAPGALDLMDGTFDEVCGSEEFDTMTTFSFWLLGWPLWSHPSTSAEQPLDI